MLTTSPVAAEQPWRNRSAGQSERDSSSSATVCEPSTLGSLLQGFHLPHRPANRDHHCHPTHLVSGEEDQLLVLPDATISV